MITKIVRTLSFPIQYLFPFINSIPLHLQKNIRSKTSKRKKKRSFSIDPVSHRTRSSLFHASSGGGGGKGKQSHNRPALPSTLLSPPCSHNSTLATAPLQRQRRDRDRGRERRETLPPHPGSISSPPLHPGKIPKTSSGTEVERRWKDGVEAVCVHCRGIKAPLKLESLSPFFSLFLSLSSGGSHFRIA